MIEALKNRYWALRDKASLAAFRRLLQEGRPRKPSRYARAIRLGLWAIRVDSFVKGMYARSMRNRKLLYLAWSFPPDVNGGVYRPTAFFKYGASREWRSTIFAGPEPKTPTAAGNYLRAQVPPDVEVVRLRSAPMSLMSRRQPDPTLPRIDHGMGNVLETYFEAVEHFSDDPPELIFASGPPFHNFLAATLLARRFRARLILEYRDEWSENPFDWVDKHPDNRRWEALCLRHADLVIFTTQSQLDHQRGVFPALRQRNCVVIPNGWDPDEFQASDAPSLARGDDRLKIGFFGNFGAMGDPGPFLNDLQKVLTDKPELRSNFQLRVLGQKTMSAHAALSNFPFRECLSVEDQIPKAQACLEMMRVDYLLLLNPPELARYIQGKIFEYVRSGTPVIVYGTGGEADEIIQKCGAGVTIATGDTDRLAQLLTNGRTSTNHSKIADAWLLEHQRDHLAQVMLETINRVTEKKLYA